LRTVGEGERGRQPNVRSVSGWVGGRREAGRKQVE
jgi:hypothetical protein